MKNWLRWSLKDNVMMGVSPGESLVRPRLIHRFDVQPNCERMASCPCLLLKNTSGMTFILIALEKKWWTPYENHPNYKRSVNIITKLNHMRISIRSSSGHHQPYNSLIFVAEAADPNAPPPRSNHTTSLHENSVVLFGGHGGARWVKGDGKVLMVT